MAMITCRECGKQISDTADICPHCGAKVNQITVKSSASSKHLIIYATLIILGASGNNISPKASTRSANAICNDYVGEDNSFITSPRIVSSSDMVVSLLARLIEMLLDLSANFSMSLLFLLLRWSITFSS